MYLCQSLFLSPSQKIAADRAAKKSCKNTQKPFRAACAGESPFVSTIITQSVIAVNCFFHFFLANFRQKSRLFGRTSPLFLPKEPQNFVVLQGENRQKSHRKACRISHKLAAKKNEKIVDSFHRLRYNSSYKRISPTIPSTKKVRVFLRGVFAFFG